MNKPIGRMRWAIPEGYIPSQSHGPEPEMISHETACLLNASDRDAHVEITIFFADREPVGPVPARRTKHLRFNDLREPESMASGWLCTITCRSRRPRGWPGCLNLKP
jgi:hypothetical protein